MGKRTFLRVLAMADTQCGHLYGLTPPGWGATPTPGFTDEDGNILNEREKAAAAAVEFWNWFKSVVEPLKPIDVLIFNGDAIDGNQKRSGATECWTADRAQQVDMAADIVEYIRPKRALFTRGTPYHVGTAEDWEDQLAHRIGEQDWCEESCIKDHLFADIRGTVFDVKHEAGRTSVPYSKATQVSKHQLFNVLQADAGIEPKSDILLRAHAHLYIAVDGPDFLAVSMPSLQLHSKHGARRVLGDVDIGIMHFDLYDGGRYSWTKHLVQLESRKAEVVTVST